MKDKDETKEQLIEEMAEMRQRIAELEISASEPNQHEEADIYGEIAKTMNDGLVTITPEGVIADINDYFTRMTGWTKQDLVGTKVPFKFWVEEDIPRITATLADLQTRDKTVQAFEQRLQKKDGGVVCTLVNSTIIYDTKGKQRLFFGIFRDITKRKQAEVALRESEERYRSLMNLGGEVGEAVVMLQDAEQGEAIQTFVSDQWPRITGYSRKELLGISFFDLIHPKDRQASLKRHRRKMSGEAMPGLFEMSIIRKDGTEVPIELTSAYTTYQGRTANVAFIRDITERKRAEDEAKWLAEFPSENPNPVLRITKDGTILYANQASLALLSTWNSQVGNLLPESWREFVVDVIHSGSPKVAEVKCEEQMLSLTFAPVVDREYVNLYGLDITERKWIEAELRKHREHLEELVEERTKELQGAQERLLASERLATLGQFSGSISHELRNPLGVIDSSAYYLTTKLQDADEKVQEHLERIRSSVGNATAVIDSLLNLTRIKEPQLEVLDLIAITDDAIATSEVPATVNVMRDFPEPEVLVNADREQLGRAFRNIVKNAVEAMDGKGMLTVTVRRTADGQVEVSFADTGPGISAENLDRVFQPLFTTKAKGVGFGLSIAKMIIDKSGGIIKAESEPGKGAIIVIRLPLYVGKVKEV